MEQLPVHFELADVPTLDEVEDTIKAMKNTKATGEDGVPSALFQLCNEEPLILA